MVRAVVLIMGTILTGIVLFAASAAATSPDWIHMQLWVDDSLDLQADDTESCNYKNVRFQNYRYNVNWNICVTEGEGWSAGEVGFVDVARDELFKSSIVSLDPEVSSTVYEVTPDIFNVYSYTDTWIPIQGSSGAIYLHGSRQDGGFQLYRYDDMPSKFHQNDPGSKVAGYTFDSGSYDFHLTRPDGEVLNVLDFTMSDNGKWAVMEVQDEGVVVMDIETNSVRRVLPFNDNDWQAFIDEKGGFAISNDGMYVALMTTEQQVMTNLEFSCGDTIEDQAGGSTALKNPCKMRDLGATLGEYTESPRYVNLSFDDQMRWLDFDVGAEVMVTLVPSHTIDTDMPAARIRLTTEKPVQPLVYLALGDSYSSGEGDIGKKLDGSSYYLSNPINDRVCHLSSRSYPFLLRDKWGISKDNMNSVACSGAEIVVDFMPHRDYMGQRRELAELSEEMKETKRNTALKNLYPGIVPQIEFVKKYKPEILTFTGGGNDVGFANIIEYCATPTYVDFLIGWSCAYATDPQFRANLNRRIDDQYFYSKRFIEEIQSASPRTQIYIIGYPQFVAESGLWCDNKSIMLNHAERKMIVESVTRLNNILKEVARDTGVYYVDIEDSLSGGKICEDSAYMTGPLRVAVNNKSLHKDANMFHPNSAGHIKMADTIYQRIENPDEYKVLDIPTEQNGWRTQSVDVLPEYSGIGNAYTIEMGPWMFGPDGQVLIEMFSNRVGLGTFRTESDGSLRAVVTIPKSVGFGYHLLTLTGEDTNGEKIQYQQFVYITSNISGDIDGDGIPDARDNCNFITQWIENRVDICKQKVESANPSMKDPHVLDTMLMAAEPLIPSNQSISITIDSQHDQSRTPSSKKIPKQANRNMLGHPHTASILLASTLIITIGVAIYVKKRHQAKP